MYPIKQSTAITVPFFVHDVSGDAVTGLVDAGFTKRISKNGGVFAAMTVTITEMENGFYSIPLSTTHSDTLGLLTILFTHATPKQINLQFRVHARLPDDLAFPTTTGRAIDVTATGEVGLDLGNVSGVLGNANVGWVDGSNLVDITQVAADKAWSTTTRVLTAFSTGLAVSIWDVLTSAVVTVGSIGLQLKDNLDVVVSTRLAPTVAGRTIDLTVGGAAGIDWANVEGQATAVTLSSTTVGTTTANTDMRGTDSALLAANVPTNFSDLAITVTTGQVIMGSTSTDAITATSIAANAIGASEFAQGAADKVWSTTSRTLTEGITKNAIFSNFEFLMVLTSDHVSPATGLTVTGQRSIDAGAFVGVTGVITEVSNGIYQFDALAVDTNGDVITWRFSSATADDTFVTFTTSA